MKKPRAQAGLFSFRAAHGFFRHSLRNFFRASDVISLAVACALHCFILACCGVISLLGSAAASFEAAGVDADRHSFMKLLRASPFRFCLAASALQAFIFSCWGVAANAGTPASERQRSAIIFFIYFPRACFG